MSEKSDLLLRMIQGLSQELQPGFSRELTLQSSLVRDAGIDSLARIELLLRIDRDFGVTFSEERAMEEAEGIDPAPVEFEKQIISAED